MEALRSGMLIDGDLVRRGRVAPVDEHELGACGVPFHAPVEDEVSVAARDEPVELVGKAKLGDVGKVLLRLQIRRVGALSHPLLPARVHLLRLLAGDASEQRHEAVAGVASAGRSGEPRALVEHRLDHLLAVLLGEEDELRLPVLVRVQVRVGPVLGERRDVVADLALRVEHHVPQEHVRLGIDGLPVGVVLGEAFREPERECLDGAVEARARGALGYLLDLELVRHLVRRDDGEELPVARVGERHAQVLGTRHAQGAFLHVEHVRFEELAVRVVEDVGDLERGLVIEPVRQVRPTLPHQSRGDARDRVLAVVVVETDSGGAVVLEEVEVAPVEIEVPDDVFPGARGNHVCFLLPRLLLLRRPLLPGEVPERVVAVPGKILARPIERQLRREAHRPCGSSLCERGGRGKRADYEQAKRGCLRHAMSPGWSDYRIVG